MMVGVPETSQWKKSDLFAGGEGYGPAYLKPVKSAPQQISEAIRQSILDGTLAPGAQLPTEAELAATFSVSRPTLREALRELHSAGLLVPGRGRGNHHRIAEFSPRWLANSVTEYVTMSVASRTTTATQLAEVRGSLEVLAAELAAVNRTDEELERLFEAIPDSDERDHETLMRQDMHFHRTLAEATHNPLLVAYIGAGIVAVQKFTGQMHAYSDRLVAHLDEVHAAVAEKDPAKAAEAMRTHLHHFAGFYAPGEAPKGCDEEA
jgi:DNA-binding FadR family transcriptional regulator